MPAESPEPPAPPDLGARICFGALIVAAPTAMAVALSGRLPPSTGLALVALGALLGAAGAFALRDRRMRLPAAIANGCGAALARLAILLAIAGIPYIIWDWLVRLADRLGIWRDLGAGIALGCKIALGALFGWPTLGALIGMVRGEKVRAGPDCYPVTLEQAEAGGVPGDDLGALEAAMRPGDELWFWSSPGWTWSIGAGRAGYVVVRAGRATRHRITTRMS